jgi:hypothetical protein
MHHIDGDITVHYSPAEVGELLSAVEKLTTVEGVTMLRLASRFTHWVNSGIKKGLTIYHKSLN